ncbi:MAG: zinc-ribbon domain containing protein [Dehalococcoidia bacterium]
MNFTDKTLTCADCGSSFIFSADDQAFHQEKGFTNEPRRCQSCRAAKRAERNSSGGSSYGGGRSYGGGGGGGSYGGSREMFSTTCSQCGKEAQVPFQPRGDKPVYCSDCFRRQRSSGGSSYGGSSGGGGGGYGGRGSRY